MKNQELSEKLDSFTQSQSNRRKFLSQAGLLGLGVAATGLAAGTPAARAQSSSTPTQDTVKEIVTAILIAEDLATTFYYNALIGAVIQDPNLAGPGGTATNVSANGNMPNVVYLRGALTEEISHATLARTILGYPSAAGDPYQTFYFGAGTFTTLSTFVATLEALENAFIGAYLNAIQEFITKAVTGQGGYYTDPDGTQYSSQELLYFAKVAASIMGVECEHRVLGLVITNTDLPNDRNYQMLDGLHSVYNGSTSAVAALTPFLTPSTGTGYSLATALAGQGSVSIAVPNTDPPAPN